MDNVEEVKDILVNCCDGTLVNVTHASDEQIHQVQIAKALQKLCRFGGQCKTTWQVAQHSLLVSRILRDMGYQTEIQLAGLLHDFQEAYINDITTPIKRELPDYYKYEKLLQDAIMHHYKLEQLDRYPEYVEADELALRVEAYVLIGKDSAWSKLDPERFNDSRVFKYIGLIKTEQPDIVAGKLLIELAKLLKNASFDVPEVLDSYWYREWYKANQIYGDLYGRIIPIIAYNKEVYLLGVYELSYNQENETVYSEEFLDIIRTDKQSHVCKAVKNKRAKMQLVSHISELVDLMYYAKPRKEETETGCYDNNVIYINRAILKKIFNT